MNLDYIKMFIAVYRAGSFIEVANEQGLAPSSVSRSIGALENALKTRLFQRTTRSLMPTREGEAYFQKIVPLVEEIELAHQSLMDSAAKPSGRLRVTTSVSYGQIMIAPRLASFRQHFPNIDLELILSDGHLDLINDQIDLAIRHGSLSDSSLVARKLADVAYHLVCSPRYLEQRSRPRKPEDLHAHELITFTYEDFRHKWVFKKKEMSQGLSIKPALTVSNAATIRQCARDGAGIALLADWTISDDLQSGRLIKVLPDWRISGTASASAIWLVYPSNRFVPAKTRAFADFLLGSVNGP